MNTFLDLVSLFGLWWSFSCLGIFAMFLPTVAASIYDKRYSSKAYVKYLLVNFTILLFSLGLNYLRGGFLYLSLDEMFNLLSAKMLYISFAINALIILFLYLNQKKLAK